MPGRMISLVSLGLLCCLHACFPIRCGCLRPHDFVLALAPHLPPACLPLVNLFPSYVYVSLARTCLPVCCGCLGPDDVAFILFATRFSASLLCAAGALGPRDFALVSQYPVCAVGRRPHLSPACFPLVCFSPIFCGCRLSSRTLWLPCTPIFLNDSLHSRGVSLGWKRILSGPLIS